MSLIRRYTKYGTVTEDINRPCLFCFVSKTLLTEGISKIDIPCINPTILDIRQMQLGLGSAQTSSHIKL